MVEWNGNGPEIRTSMDEEEIGIALATAGYTKLSGTNFRTSGK